MGKHEGSRSKGRGRKQANAAGPPQAAKKAVGIVAVGCDSTQESGEAPQPQQAIYILIPDVRDTDIKHHID